MTDERPAQDPPSFEALSQPIADRAAAGVERLGLAVQSRAWAIAGRRGLTATQVRILALLAQADTSMGTNALARRLQVTAPTVSDAVAALERKGLVERRRQAGDRRAIVVRATAGGRRAARAATPGEAVRAAVASLPEALQVHLLKGLLGTIRALQEAGAIPDQRACLTCRHFRPNVRADVRAPHHCALVDAPFGDRHLRLDCREHTLAPERDQRAAWVRFAAPPGDSRTEEHER